MPKLSEILGESYSQIPEDLKKKYNNIDLVDSSSYVEKRELDTANATITQYKKDIKKRDSDLTDLQGKVKDNEELNTEIENLKAANKKASDDYEAKLSQITFDSKLEKKLSEYNPHNVGILKKAIDSSKISLDGDNFLGLDEQIKALNETDKYLFKETVNAEDQKKGTGIIGSNNTFVDDKSNSSIGAILAKAKTENKNAEAQNKFFA